MRLSTKILCIALLASATSAIGQTPKNVKPSPALQKEYDGFIAKFRAALKANDSGAVAGMTKFPFYYDDAMRDAAYFRAKAYPFYFTQRNRSCIERGKGVHDRDGENNDNYFIFCGQLIFVFTKTADGFVFSEVGAND